MAAPNGPNATGGRLRARAAPFVPAAAAHPPVPAPAPRQLLYQQRYPAPTPYFYAPPPPPPPQYLMQQPNMQQPQAAVQAAAHGAAYVRAADGPQKAERAHKQRRRRGRRRGGKKRTAEGTATGAKADAHEAHEAREALRTGVTPRVRANSGERWKRSVAELQADLVEVFASKAAVSVAPAGDAQVDDHAHIPAQQTCCPAHAPAAGEAAATVESLSRPAEPAGPPPPWPDLPPDALALVAACLSREGELRDLMSFTAACRSFRCAAVAAAVVIRAPSLASEDAPAAVLAAASVARMCPAATILDLTAADAADAEVAEALRPLRRLRALVLDRNARVTDHTMDTLIGRADEGDADGPADGPADVAVLGAHAALAIAPPEAAAPALEPLYALTPEEGCDEAALAPRTPLATLSVQRCYGMRTRGMLRLLQPQPKESRLRNLRVLLLSHVAMPSSFSAAAMGVAKSGGAPALPSLRALGLLNCVAEAATADDLISAAAGLSPNLAALLLGGTVLSPAHAPVASPPEEMALVVAAEAALPSLALLECTFCSRGRPRVGGWDLMRPTDALALARSGARRLGARGFGPTDSALMLRAAAQCAASGQRAPLHLAAAAAARADGGEHPIGADEHCLALLALGARIDFRDTSGATALFRAAEAGCYEAARALAFAGASPLAATNAGETPLYIAALRAYDDVVRSLLEASAAHGVDWARRGAYADGWTPLHAAAVGDRVTIAAALLQAAGETWGADASRSLADERNRHGQTAAHVAARRGSLGMLRVLVGAGADLSVRDNMGRTPANVARREGKIEALALIAAAAGDDLTSARRAARRHPSKGATDGAGGSGRGVHLRTQQRRSSVPTDSFAISAALCQ